MREKSYDWTPLQIAGARTLHILKRDFEPKCPDCSCGVLRPKCYYESEDCPRHELAAQFEDVLSKIKKVHDLPTNFHLNLDMPLFFVVGPCSYKTYTLIAWMMEHGGRVSGPSHTEQFNDLSKNNFGHWSAQGNTWTFHLSSQISVYLSDFAKYEAETFEQYVRRYEEESKTPLDQEDSHEAE